MPVQFQSSFRAAIRRLAVVTVLSITSAVAVLHFVSTLSSPAAFAAPGAITVNSTADEPDADPLDGNCVSVPSGRCTLRAAIMEANAHAGPATIIVPAGIYTLTRVLLDDDANGGDLDIRDDVSIQGAGSGLTIIDGNHTQTLDRVFHVIETASASNYFTLTGVTIRNGQGVTPTGSLADRGGGIYIDSNDFVTVTLNDVQLEGNSAYQGGGLYAHFANVYINNSLVQANKAGYYGGGLSGEYGRFTLVNTTVQENSATDGGGAGSPYGYDLSLDHSMMQNNSATEDGGGAYGVTALALSSSSVHANSAGRDGGGVWTNSVVADIHDSQIYSNSAVRYGGGLRLGTVYGSPFQNDEFYSNTADLGGAIYSLSTTALDFHDSSLHHNHAVTGGGALYILSYPALFLLRSTVDTNSAGLLGGGIVISDVDSPLSAQIKDSTISHNSAQFGGGVYQNAPSGTTNQLVMENSTVSGNSVSHDGGGLYNDGAARTTLLNVTLAANRLLRPNSQFYPSSGGGVFIRLVGTITLQNTLIGDNFFTNGINQAHADDCDTGPTSLRSLGYNLVETITNCLILGVTGSNITGQDPQLGPLQLNGGTTQTQAPRDGSPAIDAGDPTGCKNHFGQVLIRDQRGFARTGNLRCDIGAVEYYAPAGFLPVIVR